MAFEVKPRTDIFKVQNIEGVPEHVFFSEWKPARCLADTAWGVEENIII